MNALKPNNMNANSETTTRIIGFSGNKSYAMIKLSVNPFDCCGKTVYIPATACGDKSKGDMVTIPAGWKTITKTGEDGETFKFKDGVEQLYLTYS